MAWLAKNVLLMHLKDTLYNILLKSVRVSNNHFININGAFTNCTLIDSIATRVLPQMRTRGGGVPPTETVTESLVLWHRATLVPSVIFKKNNSWSAVQCNEA